MDLGARGRGAQGTKRIDVEGVEGVGNREGDTLPAVERHNLPNRARN